MAHSNDFSRFWLSTLCGVSGLALTITSDVEAQTRPPTVVELYTSQGCSSCPPANANLAEISKRPGILALSFSVTYWDRLGWKDTFARADYTNRQAVYERPLGESGPFTPQMVLNGKTSLIGNDLHELDTAISAEAAKRPITAPVLSLTTEQVKIGSGAEPKSPCDVWLVRYDPSVVEVPVRRGENTGHTLPHKNVVHDLAHIGFWSGEPETFRLPSPSSGLRTAILVQAPQGGAILTSVTN